MKIALDAAAGDLGLKPNIAGAVKAVADAGVEALLVGPAAEIRAELTRHRISYSDRRFEIVDCRDVVGMAEDPSAACRARPGCSIMVAAEAVARGRAAALVSAGHSGATMVAALWHLKRIPGILRPAIAVAVPTPRGHCVVLDAGANTDCRPWHLLQFAVMGSVYSRRALACAEPVVGLLSVGEEESKGNELTREALGLLKTSGLRFRGPVEGRDIAAGACDVAVCDGFTGNIVIKTVEGAAAALMDSLHAELRSTALGRIGGLFARRALDRASALLSPDTHGGGPLLGVAGAVVVAHGRSSPAAIASAMRAAKRIAESGVADHIARASRPHHPVHSKETAEVSL